MADALVIENLGKTFRLGLRMRKVVALDDLTLRVKEGSIFGFVGPNGAGKTTTIKALVGLIRPSRGWARVFGQPIGAPASRWALGYLPENPAFHDFLRPAEVLALMGKLSGMSGSNLDRRIDEVLELVGLGQARDLTVRKFSKGMVQRLGLAQAVLHDPPLLVLDEPMSGLDPIGRKDVRDLIVALRRRGKTIFFSTHILNDVETVCDRVGMLLRGRLIAEGPLGALLGGSVRAVELRCAGLGEDAFAAVRELATEGSSDPEGFAFAFADVEAANRAAQQVLAAGGRILALQPQRETLEESFVRLVTANQCSPGIETPAHG